MKKMTFKMRPVAIALISVLSLQGCAQLDTAKKTMKETFASDDPCGNNARNIGTAIGAIIGAVAGNQIADNKTIGTIGGTVIGGAIGWFIGAEVDKRQCELSKIGQKYNLDMQVTPLAISAVAEPTATQSKTEATANDATKPTPTVQNVGLSVSVTDADGKPQFNSGSGELQAYARVHFSEIAKLYSARDQAEILGGGKTDEEKKVIFDQLSKRRILLIGHTDDTGNSKANAELSEKRAKAVAKLFKENGVNENQLFYQGAGETMPIDDNATPEGRAKNRRVEIVDLTNDEEFKIYLQNRHVKTEYYRPVDPTNNVQVQSEAKPQKTQASKSKKTKVSNSQQTQTNKSQPTEVSKPKQIQANMPQEQPRTSAWIDFGGSPITNQNTTVNIGKIEKVKPKFSLISEAEASDIQHISTCNLDRPRNSGQVKSLKDSKEYKVYEHLPGLYGGSWSGKVNGHLVALTKVAVLRDDNSLAKNPDLIIYKDFKGDKDKPFYQSTPEVNVYKGDQALLYRVFDSGAIKCIDVVVPNNSPKSAPNSTIFYSKNKILHSTSFSLITK